MHGQPQCILMKTRHGVLALHDLYRRRRALLRLPHSRALQWMNYMPWNGKKRCAVPSTRQYTPRRFAGRNLKRVTPDHILRESAGAPTQVPLLDLWLPAAGLHMTDVIWAPPVKQYGKPVLSVMRKNCQRMTIIQTTLGGG
jgi:hypothetical protein